MSRKNVKKRFKNIYSEYSMVTECRKTTTGRLPITYDEMPVLRLRKGVLTLRCPLGN